MTANLNMNIPLLDPKAQYQDIKEELAPRLDEILGSGSYVLGPNVDALEEEVAAYIGTSHAVAVASGTDAIYLALAATGIGPGDEVITTPFTSIATADAISRLGATPVFVDVEDSTYNMDMDLLPSALTERTRAILPVHLFGMPVKVGPLLEFAVTHGLQLVEDCAHSFGANYKFSRTGCFGDAGCFSFHPETNLGCFGDGGMVTTDSEKTAAKLRLLRDHGRPDGLGRTVAGCNSRMDDIQAGILLVKLGRVDTYNRLRRERAAQYRQGLAGIPGVRTPKDVSGYFHVYNRYTVQVDDREKLVSALDRAGIGSGVYYSKPVHLQDAYAYLGYSNGAFPAAEALSETVLSLPMYPELKPEDVDQVCNTIRSSFCHDE